MDLLAVSNAWLEGKRHDDLTQDVAYARGSLTANFKGTILETVYQIQDSDGFLSEARTIDFVFRSSDLAQFGEPEKGDKITRWINGEKVTYQLRHPTGEPVFKRDTNNLSTRVFTQVVDESTC